MILIGVDPHKGSHTAVAIVLGVAYTGMKRKAIGTFDQFLSEADNKARNEGRYELWSKIDFESPRVSRLIDLMVRRGVFKNQLVRGPVGFTLDDHARAEVDRIFDRLQTVL